MIDQPFYPGRETKILEFKSTIKKFDGIIKTAIAFANGVGGKIIIGVDDKTRVILGVDNQLRDKVYDDFPNSLYDSTSPHLIPQIYEQSFGELAVIVIEIPPTLKRPCFLKSRGLPKGVYLRVGSSTRVASEESIEELMRENQRKTYDEESLQIDLSVLSKERLVSYYKKKSREALIEDKVITRSEVNPENYFPTVAGVLLFSNEPDRYIPEAHIVCTRFSGTSGRDIIQTEEIKGSISQQIEVSFNLVGSWLKRNYRLEGIKMKSDSLVPEEALREVITNAVIHRKYTVPGASKIALYDDRLEVFSPGNFPGHVNINNLGEGITHLRNPVLARMAHKMRILEKLGSGIRLIFDSCKAAGLVPPVFSEDGDYVKVTFKFQPIKKLNESDDSRLMELFRSREVLTLREMVEYLGRSRNTVFAILHELMDKNLVERLGKGRATRYFLKR